MSSSGWSWSPAVERLAADDAQPRAVRPAERRDRLGEDDRLADRRLEVHLVVVGQAQRVGLVVDGHRLAGREVDRRQVLLVGSRGRAGSSRSARQRLQSPASAVVRSASARMPRFVRDSRTAPVDRRGQDEVVGQVDPDVLRPAYSRSDPTASARSPATFQMSGLVRSGGRSWAGRGCAASSGSSAQLAVVARRAAPRRPATRSARRSSSIAIPFLMLWRVLTTSPSRPTSTPTAYSSAPRRISSASWCASPMIAPALGLGLLGEAALVDEERRLLLGLGDDPLGLVLGLLDDPLALGVDPLGGADLLGDGDAQLVDEAERGVLVDDDVGRQRQLLAVRDQRLEALDEEDDVDRSALLARRMLTLARVAAIMARGPCASAPRECLVAGPSGRPRRDHRRRRRRRTPRSP